MPNAIRVGLTRFIVVSTDTRARLSVIDAPSKLTAQITAETMFGRKVLVFSGVPSKP